MIDPDKSIFGIPLGTTEDEFIRKNGKPTGYLNLEDGETALLYGNCHAFFFKRGKLVGVLLTHATVDRQLFERMAMETDFPSLRGWKLSNGVKAEMTLPEVRSILGDRLTAKSIQLLHNQYFLTEESRVDLSFGRAMGKAQDDEEGYTLSSVFISPRSSSDD